MYIDLNNKIFQVYSNPNGLSNENTNFYYFQDKELVYGYYKGGEIVYGNFVGKFINKSNLELVFQSLSKDGILASGNAQGKIEYNEEKLCITYFWKWINGFNEEGISKYIEVEK